jgi:hypothetical protein
LYGTAFEDLLLFRRGRQIRQALPPLRLVLSFAFSASRRTFTVAGGGSLPVRSSARTIISDVASPAVTARAAATIQMRIAKAQEARGKPHGLKAPWVTAVTTTTRANRLLNDLGRFRRSKRVYVRIGRRGKVTTGATKA